MENNLIPFGKYRGQPVEQLQHDPEYATWLLKQPWFVEKYTTIQTLIVNNFKEASDSPDHNAFQAKFLDLQFAFSVAFKAKGWVEFEKWESSKLAAFRNQFEKENYSERGHSKIEFEVGGWDVVIEFKYHASGRFPGHYNDPSHGCTWGGTCQCELKPSIGEDFPSVLRQVKARLAGESRSSIGGCVIVEDFNAKSVSF